MVARLGRRPGLRLWRALARPAGAMLRSVLDPPLGGLLLALLLGWTLLAVLPLRATVGIGRAEGRGNDAPFVDGFQAAELRMDDGLRFRWTAPLSALRFHNVPAGLYRFETRHLLGGPAVLRVAGVRLDLAQAREPRRLSVLLPSNGQNVDLVIRSKPTFQPNDPRKLGLALAEGRLSQLARDGLLPPWRPLLGAAALLCACWAAARLLGAGRREAALVVGALLAALLAALARDPLRAGLAGEPLALAALCLLGALAALAPLLGALARRLGQPLVDPWRRWLLLAAASLFALAFAGRFFPAAMEGDIGFHTNRFLDLVKGEPFAVANNRGVLFPYPSALYLLIAPLAVLLPPELALQLVAAGLTALALPIIYVLVLRATGRQRAALLAALLYGLFPATHMPIWWSFDSHIFAQWAALAGSAYLVLRWERLAERRVWLGMAAWLLLASLGHFGFYINMSLLIGVVALGCALVRPARRKALALIMALAVAQLLAWALFYGSYLELFAAQREALASGGVGAVSERATASATQMLRSVLVDGAWGHYALLPLLLAPVGLLLLARARGAARPLALVIGATFVVSLALGAVPFLTGSSLSTRWLSFAGASIAIAAAVALDRLLQRGAVARALALAVPLFVGWWGLRLSLLALIYYVRPPEPF